MSKRKSSKRKGLQAEVALTEVEWTIMGIVWNQYPCAAGTVQESLDQSHGWAYSTIKTTMDRMVAKGLLATSTIRNLTLYSPLINQQQARLGELQRFLRRAFSGAISPLIQFLVEQEELSDVELDQLREMISKIPPKAPPGK